MDESPETNAIRQRMEEVRGELAEDVRAIVESARDMGEWRSYVKTYPWACAGAALALGYWIVPQRPFVMQPDPQTLAELASQNRLPSQTNVRGMLLGFAGNLVLRGVLSFVGQQAGRLFTTQAGRSQPDEQP